MRRMKNSNTKWLGDIPADWEISRIGSVYTLRNTKVSDRDYEPLSVTMNGVVPQLESAAKTNAHDDRKLVKKGDFAINSRSDRRGSCGISDRDGSVSLINTILCPNGEMNPDYYNWLFHTTQFADEFYANGHGIVDDLWTTGWQEMKRILIPLPSLVVQEAIANFLNQKCSEIDSLFADIKSQIDVLEEYKKSIITEAVTKGLNPDVEMKDSGIEWIGMTPEDWNIVPVKHFFSIGRGRVISVLDLSDDGEYPVYSSQTENNGCFGYLKTYDYSGPSITWTTDGAKAGTVFFRDGKYNCTNVCGILTFKNGNFEKSNIKFMTYAIGMVAEQNKRKDINGYKIMSNEMANIKFAVPPLNIQTIIANYLDQKCSEIDAIIADKKAQLETLAEYKKSLIYEYVTGKKEVPHKNTVITIDPHILLLGMIADKLNTKQEGRVQVQKVAYLSNLFLEIYPNTQYHRYYYGPYDTNLPIYYDTITKNDWYKNPPNKTIIVAGKNHNDFKNQYHTLFGDKEKDIDDLLNLLETMNALNTDRLECVATLYAVWNDFLLDGITPSDEQIIKETMMNWTENKRYTPIKIWQFWLNRMKNYGLIPKGNGYKTSTIPIKEVITNELSKD